MLGAHGGALSAVNGWGPAYDNDEAEDGVIYTRVSEGENSPSFTVAIDCMPSERTINEALAYREREKELKAAEALLRSKGDDKESTAAASSRQSISPMRSDANGSDNCEDEQGTMVDGTESAYLKHKNTLPVSLINCLPPDAHLVPEPAMSCANHASTFPKSVGEPAKEPKRAKQPNLNWEEGVVTAMIRQIPRQYTQLMFLAQMANRGFKGLVDFIYFPFDLKKGTNVGYGFVNFTDPYHAWKFLQEFDNVYLDIDMEAKEKPLRIHPATVQGYDANFMHFVQTKTGQKADRQFSPIFMPRGSWASLPEDIQMELETLQQACDACPIIPRGSQTAAQETTKPAASLARRCPEPHEVELRGRWPEQVSGEASWYGNSGSNSLVPAWQRLAAKLDGTPSPRRVPLPVPPPGLQQQHAGGICQRFGAMEARRRPSGSAMPSPAQPEFMRIGSSYDIMEAQAERASFSGAYHHLEEQKQKLLRELAFVQEEQRRALRNSISAAAASKMPAPHIPPPCGLGYQLSF